MNSKLFWLFATGLMVAVFFATQNDAFAQSATGVTVPIPDVGTFNIRAGDVTVPLAMAVAGWFMGKIEPKIAVELKWPEDSKLQVELDKDTIEALTKKAP